MIMKTVSTDLHRSYPSSFEVSHECYLGTSLVLIIKFICSLKTTFDTCGNAYSFVINTIGQRYKKIMFSQASDMY